MRKLVTVREIISIEPIPDADNIEVATVDGWKVVVKKGDFKLGDWVLYFEIDSFVPTSVAPFLTKSGKEPSEYKGVKGERLKTIRLRKQLSQGLVLPLDFKAKLGEDVTEKLGVIKWERPEVEIKGQNQPKGNFPTFLRKTDEERIQNCFDKFDPEETFEVTLKLDGSSCSIFRLTDWEDIRVCSRNLELKVYKPVTGLWNRLRNKLGLKVKKELFDNPWSIMAHRLREKVPEGYCVQGELMGPRIQGNREGFDDLEFFCYNVWHIPSQKYLLPQARRVFCSTHGIQHVPVDFVRKKMPSSIEEALESVNKLPSINHKVAEGVVFKSTEVSGRSFKVISNRYLLKEDG